MKDLVLMKERPLFTAALVFSSPSLVPSFAAFTSFCIWGEREREELCGSAPACALSHSTWTEHGRGVRSENPRHWLFGRETPWLHRCGFGWLAGF